MGGCENGGESGEVRVGVGVWNGRNPGYVGMRGHQSRETAGTWE